MLSLIKPSNTPIVVPEKNLVVILPNVISLYIVTIIGSDETGMRINNKNCYLWTFQNE